ncbi:MAG: DNA-processing protein DprA, partial [bacterium]|nr:DNA-processing protein DprA [bacterium]
MEDRGYWLGFSAFSGVGPMKFQKLLRYFKTARDTWKASESQLQSSGLGEKLTQKFIAFRNKFSIELYAEQLEKKGVNYLTFSDKEYPGLLAQIKNPPFVLYVKGQMPAEVANENFFVPHSHAARHA